jgi:hypothetical protein
MTKGERSIMTMCDDTGMSSRALAFKSLPAMSYIVLSLPFAYLNSPYIVLMTTCLFVYRLYPSKDLLLTLSSTVFFDILPTNINHDLTYDTSQIFFLSLVICTTIHLILLLWRGDIRTRHLQPSARYTPKPQVENRHRKPRLQGRFGGRAIGWVLWRNHLPTMSTY